MSSIEWKAFKKHWLHVPALEMALDTSRVHFDEGFWESMQSRIARALQSMEELESGAIANPDEKRMVGHYWLRNVSLAPQPSIREQLRANEARRKAFVNQVLHGEVCGANGRFEHLLCIGIGGSALGVQLLTDAFGRKTDGLHATFMDNTDPDGIACVLKTLRDQLGKTLVVVTSKSGRTPEPRNALMEVRAAFQSCGIPFAPQAIAITGEGSVLDQQALGEQWLARFPIWDWVGGRTSLLSNVGLLPAALQGIEVDALVNGANLMDACTRKPMVEENPAMRLALAWYACTEGRGKRHMVVLPYKDALSLFPKYLQQLVMESLGKRLSVDGTVVEQGLTVFGNKGSTDQHAYVQQLRDGLNNAFVQFIEVLGSDVPSSVEVEPGLYSGDFLEGFFLGTRAALTEVQRPSITVTLQRLTACSLGALVALFERAVGFYASFVEINAYHQPGVEAGKKAAARYLDCEQKILAHLTAHRGDFFTAEALAEALQLVDQTEEIFKWLEFLSANGRIARETAVPLTDSRYGWT